jgi:hypothetical protein
MTLLSNVKLGIKPLVGIDFRYNNEFRYIGLAKKCERLAEMNRFWPSIISIKHLYYWSSCIWIGNHHLRFRESAKQLKTNEYIGVRPEEIEVIWLQGSLEKMIVLQPVTFRTKKNTNCIKYLEQLITIFCCLNWLSRYRCTYRGHGNWGTLAGGLQRLSAIASNTQTILLIVVIFNMILRLPKIKTLYQLLRKWYCVTYNISTSRHGMALW